MKRSSQSYHGQFQGAHSTKKKCQGPRELDHTNTETNQDHDHDHNATPKSTATSPAEGRRMTLKKLHRQVPPKEEQMDSLSEWIDLVHQRLETKINKIKIDPK